jgi:hypothetical protein
MLDWIGWIATAVFASSYWWKDQGTLRRVQAGAALLWVIYGLMIGAMPVVAANLIVATVALYSSLRSEVGQAPQPARDSQPRRS